MQIHGSPEVQQQNIAQTSNKKGSMGSRAVTQEHGSSRSSVEMQKVSARNGQEANSASIAKHSIAKFFSGIRTALGKLVDKLSSISSKLQNKQPAKPPADTSREFIASFKQKAESLGGHDSGYTSLIVAEVNHTLQAAEEFLDSKEFAKLSESEKKSCRMEILDICKNTPRIREGSGLAFETSRGEFLSKVIGKPVTVPEGTTNLGEVLKDCSAALEGIEDRRGLEQKVKDFSKEDSFKEAELKGSTKSLFGPAKELKELKINRLTQSLARLHTVKMKVTIDGETVLQSGTGKTSVGDNVGKLLVAINRSRGEDEEKIEQKVQGRVEVLEKFQPSQNEAAPLETVDSVGTPKSENSDILALKLVTKECALIAIVPFSAQIANYSKTEGLDPSIAVRGNFDQAESIDITRTENGFQAVHTFEVPIMQGQTQIATVTLKMTSQLNETTGKLEGKMARSNLRFNEGVPLSVQQHVFNALNSELPKELQ